MKVLVTGANGFIGKNLVKRLIDCGIGVYVYVIELIDIFDKPYKYVGQVMLIR